MNKQKPEDTYSTIDSANEAQFDYYKYNRLMSDIDLDVFFTQNNIPFIRPLPSLVSMKSGYIAMNERLYKRAKEAEEIRRQDPNYLSQSKLKRTYLDAFDCKKMASRKLQRKVKRNVKMYVQSQAMIHLFRSFFSLVVYHHRVSETYPLLIDEYLLTIYMIFGSTKKSIITEMFEELTTSTEMIIFLKDLYYVWENETDLEEKNCIISK